MSLLNANSLLWNIKKLTGSESVSLTVRDTFFEIHIIDGRHELLTTETLACVGSMFSQDLFIETIVESWHERKAMLESMTS